MERPAISGTGRPCGAFLDHHAHHPQSAGVGGEGLRQLLLRPDCLWRQQTRQVKVNGSEVCVSWVCVCFFFGSVAPVLYLAAGTEF